MTPKPVVPRQQAHEDVEQAVNYYLKEGGQELALRFIASLERGYAHIARHPGAGSPRYAHELDLPDLRSWPLKRFPYLIFYIERTDHIDVWRALHAERDIPASLQDPDGTEGPDF